MDGYILFWSIVGALVVLSLSDQPRLFQMFSHDHIADCAISTKIRIRSIPRKKNPPLARIPEVVVISYIPS